MNIVESSLGEIRLFVDYNAGIRMYDFQNSTIEEVNVPGIQADQMGEPINSILMNSSSVACYKS